MGAAAKPSLLCWKWPWDPNPNPNPNPNPCGSPELPWLFRSLHTLSTLAQSLLISDAAPDPPRPRPPPPPRRLHTEAGWRGRSREEQGEAEHRALAAALASGKEATVVEFYSPKCRLCASLLDLVLQVESRNSDWVSFVLADAENEMWLPEGYPGYFHKKLQSGNPRSAISMTPHRGSSNSGAPAAGLLIIRFFDSKIHHTSSKQTLSGTVPFGGEQKLGQIASPLRHQIRSVLCAIGQARKGFGENRSSDQPFAHHRGPFSSPQSPAAPIS